MALGGHDLVWQGDVLAKPWLCRVCHRSAAQRERLVVTRCPGSAVLRWARLAASAAASGVGMGSGHRLLLTGSIVWCWRCGAYACARARHLARPCPGRLRAFAAHARRRLLLGLHPTTRAPLGVVTVAEPGCELPVGFEAEASAAASRVAVAGAPRRALLPLLPPPPPSPPGLHVVPLVASPASVRMAALRARVRARAWEMEIEIGAEPTRPLPKRRRLSGMPSPPASVRV